MASSCNQTLEMPFVKKEESFVGTMFPFGAPSGKIGFGAGGGFCFAPNGNDSNQVDNAVESDTAAQEEEETPPVSLPVPVGNWNLTEGVQVYPIDILSRIGRKECWQQHFLLCFSVAFGESILIQRARALPSVRHQSVSDGDPVFLANALPCHTSAEV